MERHRSLGRKQRTTFVNENGRNFIHQLLNPSLPIDFGIAKTEASRRAGGDGRWQFNRVAEAITDLPEDLLMPDE